MPWRVRSILLVSSPYDAFTFQEDGNLTELLISEYLELNLRYAPIITRVSTADEAIAHTRNKSPDLVITMPRVGEMDVFKFGRAIKDSRPNLPTVLLAYDTRELALLKTREDIAGIDRIFVWQGDARLFLAIIKWAEDLMNAVHDAKAAGVKSIILIEDSVRFYSAYLPLLYTEIVEQTQALMAEGANRMQKLLRMRARPKIILGTSFEEGAHLLRHHQDHVLGVIIDARFPRGGQTDPQAGRAFAELVGEHDPNIPILMQSTEAENRAVAASLGARFIDKTSPTLLHEVRDFLRASLGFGDFIFRRPNGSVLTAAHDIGELVTQLQTIPDDSLLYHARRNDFSTWLMARTEFDLAKALRPVTSDAFDSPAGLRDYLLAALRDYRHRSRAGLIAEFSQHDDDASCGFSRIGQGSLGGKGRGLAFVNSIMNAYDIENHIPGMRIFVPPSTILATDIFDRFMEDSGLAAYALEAHPDEEIRSAFLGAHLPADAVTALRAFLKGARFPLAVRSSSLLEDSSYQPFAGIYRTYMLPNNASSLDIRLEQLCRAIRLVYASTYYEDSRSYIESTPNRLEEEKMAVVIQQIVGQTHDQSFYPHIAGVARSYDYYPIEGLQAEDGVASVALGLGRMVVDGGRCLRFSPAHPRKLYQFSSTESYLENAQREFYALNLVGVPDSASSARSANDPLDENHVLLDLEAAMQHGTLDRIGSVYSPENDVVYEGVHRPGIKLVTMAGILSGDYLPLADALGFLLEIGKSGFSCQVEIEFAVNLRKPEDGPHEFGFLQIRPLVFGTDAEGLDLTTVAQTEAICISGGALGHGHLEGIRDLVYVPTASFDRSQTQTIADEVGSLNAALKAEGRHYVLIGPGRWGSADPWLGIPVRWAQISRVSCIVETPMEGIQVAPSQGTHFFQNITSFGIGYFTLSRQDPHAHLDLQWLDGQPAHAKKAFVRHIRFSEPLEIVVDGRRGIGVIMRPGAIAAGPLD